MLFSTLVAEYYYTCWMMMVCVQDGKCIKDIENRNKELMTLKPNKKCYRSYENDDDSVTIPLTIIPSPFYMTKLQQQQKQQCVQQDDVAFGMFQYDVDLQSRYFQCLPNGKRPVVLHSMVVTEKYRVEEGSDKKRRAVRVLVPLNETEKLLTQNELPLFEKINPFDEEERIIERLNTEIEQEELTRYMSHLQIEKQKNSKKYKKQLEKDILCSMFKKR